MIAVARPVRSRVTERHRRQFLSMLPVIRRTAATAFQTMDAESKEESIAEAVAIAYLMFVALVRRGREELAYPTVLAMYGVKRVKIGRRAATSLNVRDISSEFCQRQKHLTLERLDRFDRHTGEWLEVLVEDRRAGPAETAAARIDITTWLDLQPKRRREIAESLAAGDTPGELARRLGVSAARISQLRRALRDSWDAFQGETPLAATA